MVALLGDVEWGGDFLTGVALVGLALALVAYGFGWGRWRALAVLAAVWTIPLVAADVLYFAFDLDPLGQYCGEPECDPGPIPATILLVYLPFAAALSATGVLIRRRR